MSASRTLNSFEKTLLAILLLLILLLLVPYAGVLSSGKVEAKKNVGNRPASALENEAYSLEASLEPAPGSAPFRSKAAGGGRKLDEIEQMLGPSRYVEERE